MPAGRTVIGTYQTLMLWYLVALLYLYPYGISMGEEASLRFPDIFAVLAVFMGLAAALQKGRIAVDRALLGVVGAFVALELFAPFVGAVGYRRPADVASSIRMAMLWMPMILLALLAPSWRALRFERSVAQILTVTLWLNFGYALLQIATTVGALPSTILLTTWLEPWAVDKNYNLIQGLRPAGFFANSTALSVFGIVCLCFFFARFVSGNARQDLLRSLLSIGVIVLSTSRTAYATAALILMAGWWLLSTGRKTVIAILLAAGVGIVLLAVEQTVGVQEAFYRFQRLAESGVLEDASFGKRVNQSWPAAIEAARDYRFGTLIQAPRALPVIDSGYLNYYLQGKWPFVVVLAAMLAGLWFLGLRAYFGPESRRLGVMTLFLAIFLTAALVVSNPLRSPLMIFFIVYALWRLQIERQCTLFAVRPRDPRPWPSRPDERRTREATSPASGSATG
jgi:hypothetical protein